jgi:hypothetical protein
MPYRLGNVRRLKRVESIGNCLIHGAKAAVTSTSVAAEHESSGLVRPALENVWALCLLANRVQVQTVDQIKDSILIPRVAEFDL